MNTDSKMNNKASSDKVIPPSSFVKMAMRNMVRKGTQSLLHFGLTALVLLGFILFVAWIFRPAIPQ